MSESTDVVLRRQEFGASVRAVRKIRGLNQQELAQLAGMDRKTVLRIELGHYAPTLDRIWALADALEVAPADFFDRVQAIPDGR